MVTGGARGIGAAIVRAFAAEAARVAVLDPAAEEAARLAAEVHGRAYAVDLTDAAATREAMEKAIAWLGGIDVLVNDAGTTRFAPLLELEPADLGDTVTSPVRTMLVTTQAAAWSMIALRGPGDDCVGKIVNVAGAGCVAGGGQAHHAAATSAVTALTRAAAEELGPHGITVNCHCPGLVVGEGGVGGHDRREAAGWSARSPLGRVGEPRDVARAALFLASSDSDYLTGDALNVSGGLVLH